MSRIDDMADYIDSQVDESYQLDEKKIRDWSTSQKNLVWHMVY